LPTLESKRWGAENFRPIYILGTYRNKSKP
jgi:hypothetical protein